MRKRDWSKAVRSVQRGTLSWYDKIWWLYMTPVYSRVGGRLSLRSKGDLLAPSLIMLNTHSHAHTHTQAHTSTHALTHTHTYAHKHSHTLPFLFFLFCYFSLSFEIFLSFVILSIFCLHIYRPFYSDFLPHFSFYETFISSYWKTVAKTLSGWFIFNI